MITDVQIRASLLWDTLRLLRTPCILSQRGQNSGSAVFCTVAVKCPPPLIFMKFILIIHTCPISIPWKTFDQQWKIQGGGGGGGVLFTTRICAKKHRASHLVATRAWLTCCSLLPSSTLTCKQGQRQTRTVYAWMQLQERAACDDLGCFEHDRSFWNSEEMLGRGCNPKTFRPQGVRPCRCVNGETAWKVSEQTVNKQTASYLRWCWLTHTNSLPRGIRLMHFPK